MALVMAIAFCHALQLQMMKYAQFFYFHYIALPYSTTNLVINNGLKGAFIPTLCGIWP
jgi:hypothetical protein